MRRWCDWSRDGFLKSCCSYKYVNCYLSKLGSFTGKHLSIWVRICRLCGEICCDDVTWFELNCGRVEWRRSFRIMSISQSRNIKFWENADWKNQAVSQSVSQPASSCLGLFNDALSSVNDIASNWSVLWMKDCKVFWRKWSSPILRYLQVFSWIDWGIPRSTWWKTASRWRFKMGTCVYKIEVPTSLPGLQVCQPVRYFQHSSVRK